MRRELTRKESLEIWALIGLAMMVMLAHFTILALLATWLSHHFKPEYVFAGFGVLAGIDGALRGCAWYGE